MKKAMIEFEEQVASFEQEQELFVSIAVQEAKKKWKEDLLEKMPDIDPTKNEVDEYYMSNTLEDYVNTGYNKCLRECKKIIEEL